MKWSYVNDLKTKITQEMDQEIGNRHIWVNFQMSSQPIILCPMGSLPQFSGIQVSCFFAISFKHSTWCTTVCIFFTLHEGLK